MPNDQELLERAAKAVGIEVELFALSGFVIMSGPDSGRPWNPRDDDGDSFRLAVKLHLSIDHNHPADQQRWVAVERQGCEGCFDPVCCIEDDFEDESGRPAATRLAILRAAASIGGERGK